MNQRARRRVARPGLRLVLESLAEHLSRRNLETRAKGVLHSETFWNALQPRRAPQASPDDTHCAGRIDALERDDLAALDHRPELRAAVYAERDRARGPRHRRRRDVGRV